MSLMTSALRMRERGRAWGPVVLAAVALTSTPARAQPAVERELLNSERIGQTFGSYGIEVIENGEAVRVSNLYSGDGDDRVTRTFAVVQYPDEIDAAFAAEHETIVDGGSIGAVFTDNGWTVRKRHRFFGVLESSPRVERMMGGIAAQALATHVYVLDVLKAGTELEYAAIVEVHHPDYLSLDELRSIYGERYEPPIRVEGVEALLEALELTAGRMDGGYGLAGGRSGFTVPDLDLLDLGDGLAQ